MAIPFKDRFQFFLFFAKFDLSSASNFKSDKSRILSFVKLETENSCNKKEVNDFNPYKRNWKSNKKFLYKKNCGVNLS